MFFAFVTGLRLFSRLCARLVNMFLLPVQVIDPSAVMNDMRNYGEPGYEALTAKWDEMQRELR
jgi:hypothetical protein